MDSDGELTTWTRFFCRAPSFVIWITEEKITVTYDGNNILL